MLAQEQEIAGVWAKVIGIDIAEVDTQTNFFDLGGNSLLLITLVDCLKSELGIDTDIVTLLEFPTVDEFVSQWNARQGAAVSDPTGP